MTGGSAILFGLWVHPAMLGWLAAAAAPVLIHLLVAAHREVQWAAMQYLLAAVAQIRDASASRIGSCWRCGRRWCCWSCWPWPSRCSRHRPGKRQRSADA